MRPYVLLHASDRELEKSFDWARRQALDWVTPDSPAGAYYEAALPGRAAFCMRDVSHQCTGAEVLGLGGLNRNMLGKFAAAIDEKLDYCSYWEIDRWNRPCPVDYTDERDFWYNLPANFDVLDACYRMYRWTGDRAYLEDPAFDRFYQLTLEPYIKRWDRDGDGLPDRVASEGRRGLVSYDESHFVDEVFKVGADLLGAMARGHLSFAAISGLLGRREYAAIYRKRGEALLNKLNTEWYDAASDRYARAMRMDGSLLFESDNEFRGNFLLYWNLIPDTNRARRMAKEYAAHLPGMQVEIYSHAPELLWRYGFEAEAMDAFRHLTAPGMPRREYPEASYSAVGAAATGLMGIAPDAAEGVVRTRAGLAGVHWAELEHVPLLGGVFSVRHDGTARSCALLEAGPPIVWRAAFAGRHAQITADGAVISARHTEDAFTGEIYSFADIPLTPGKAVCAALTGHPNASAFG
jgi:hypothetical protein